MKDNRQSVFIQLIHHLTNKIYAINSKIFKI